MRKSGIFIALLLLNAGFSKAQTRVSLLEEFTGETCEPCALVNPSLDALLKQPVNAAKMIAIKWQVPIPIVPNNPASLYQTNKAEINWRYKGASNGGYGYMSQYSSTSQVNDGILNAPTNFIDGKNQWTFGADTDHPYYLKNNIIATAAAVPTPFSINMSTSWNNTFNNCIVTVTVTSSSAFSSLGTLMFRLCLVERLIEFTTAPGINGETLFHDVVRKCYPTTTSGTVVTGMGTSLNSNWTASQTQILTISCAIPANVDKSQIAFVGFVQDDGDRQVYQTTRSSQPSIPNDAMAESINIQLPVCSSTLSPSLTIKNNGSTAITNLTITPFLDGVAGADVIWAGTLAGGTSTNLSMNVITPAAGSHTYECTIVNVSGGDIVPENNSEKTFFLNASGYLPAPVTEGFEASVFPPPNWLLSDGGATYNFEKSIMAGGYNTSSQSVYYSTFYAPPGDVDELYLPPVDLIGSINSELRFDLAYQQADIANKDSLKVLLSSDCGNTWSKIYGDGGTNMATAYLPIGNNNFVPAAGQWTTHIIPLGGYTNTQNVLIKFQVKPDGGKGIYLDNINIKAGSGNPPSVTGIIEAGQPELAFDLYPNPASSNTVIRLNSIKSNYVLLEVENSLGQVVYRKTEQVSAGSNLLNIDCSNFSQGIYFVRLSGENTSGIRKLMISK